MKNHSAASAKQPKVENQSVHLLGDLKSKMMLKRMSAGSTNHWSAGKNMNRGRDIRKVEKLFVKI